MVEKNFAVSVVICRPLMRKFLARRARELLGQLRELEARPLGPRESCRYRDEKLKILRKRVENASKCQLGDTTGPFDVDGKCFDGKRYRDLMRYIGRQCFSIPYWGPHIARTEHITLVHGDAVARGMSVDDPSVTALGSQAMHGTDTQERFYDNARRKKITFFEGRHRGIYQSIVPITQGASASPELPCTGGGENHVYRHFSLIYFGGLGGKPNEVHEYVKVMG